MHQSQEALIEEIWGAISDQKAPPEKIVVAAGDPQWTAAVCRLLESHGHPARAASLTSALIKSLSPAKAYVVVCCPQANRAEELKVCRQISERADALPVYLLLALPSGCLSDPTSSFEPLADDFLITPFADAELLARIAIARRNLAERVELRQHNAQMQGLRADLEEQNRLLDEAMTYLTGANNRFAELFEGMPAACYCLDDQGRIHEWNRAAARMYGYQAHEVISRAIWDVFLPVKTRRSESDADQIKEMAQRLIDGECLYGEAVDVRRKDGSVVHVLRNTITICSADQKTRSVAISDIDITERRELERQVMEQLRALTELNVELQNGQKELARANAKLERLAATDSLTGLRNRRFFQDTVVRQFSFAVRHRLPLSLVMIDVDRFKPYNDCFGHPAGDELLRTLAGLLEHGIRNHDCIARYGGEEFVVLLPSTGAPGCIDVAERLRRAVEEYAWHLRPVTISVGAATFLPGEEQAGLDQAQELIKEADKALYLAKRNGRNQVQHFLDMPPGLRIHQAHGRGARRAA